jgi:hypothetical protein
MEKTVVGLGGGGVGVRGVSHYFAGYTVRSAYQLLTSRDATQGEHVADLIWHKQVPLKVSFFSWRLLRNRLPTRSNLLDRDIIFDVDAGCLAGCAHMETSQHLFLSCDFYGLLWHAVQS